MSKPWRLNPRLKSSGALTRAISGGITESARLKTGSMADKWRDNSQSAAGKKERERYGPYEPP